MRIPKIAFFILAFAGAISSCQKEYFKPPVIDPNTPVSFSKELQPIMTAKCALSGCHNKNIVPNLVEGESYGALMDGLYIDTLHPDKSILMLKLNTNMPPGKLPAGDIKKFLYWIQQGAQDN